MELTNNNIYSNDSGNNIKEVLITYSEDEKQENEINKANAKLVFSPKYIPIYPQLLDILTPTEAIIYGFINFYTSSGQNRFYFTNDQLSKITRSNPDTVSRAISKLEKLKLIKTHRKVKAGGGQIRFIEGQNVESDLIKTTSNAPTNPTSPTLQKLQTNNNKINKNKIKENNRSILISKNEFLPDNLSIQENNQTNEILNLFKSVNPSYQRLFSNITERKSLERLIDKYGKEKIINIVTKLPDIITQPFAPRITTPYQLEKKLGDLIIFIKQSSNKPNKLGIAII